MTYFNVNTDTLAAKSADVQNTIARLQAEGYGHFPVCVAKTQYSFSTDPTALGAPVDHDVTIREVRLSAGAGFVVALCGPILTMPGLPERPAAWGVDVVRGDDGEWSITGLR